MYCGGSFIESFGIDRGECRDAAWPTFNAFFSRRLRPDARPIAGLDDPEALHAPSPPALDESPPHRRRLQAPAAPRLTGRAGPPAATVKL